jgi:hypothetical protein
MKQAIKHFACLLAVAMVCCIITACGSDNDDDDHPTTQTVKEMLIGTWDSTDDGGDITRYILNADGSGQGIEHYMSDEGLDPDIFGITWFYDEQTHILKLVMEDPESDDGYDTDELYVSDINSTMVILYEIDSKTGKPDTSDSYILKRVK